MAPVILALALQAPGRLLVAGSATCPQESKLWLA